MGFFEKKKANLLRLRGEARELACLGFLFVSGTVVAPMVMRTPAVRDLSVLKEQV